MALNHLRRKTMHPSSFPMRRNAKSAPAVQDFLTIQLRRGTLGLSLPPASPRPHVALRLRSRPYHPWKSSPILTGRIASTTFFFTEHQEFGAVSSLLAGRLFHSLFQRLHLDDPHFKVTLHDSRCALFGTFFMNGRRPRSVHKTRRFVFVVQSSPTSTDWRILPPTGSTTSPRLTHPETEALADARRFADALVSSNSINSSCPHPETEVLVHARQSPAARESRRSAAVFWLEAPTPALPPTAPPSAARDKRRLVWQSATGFCFETPSTCSRRGQCKKKRKTRL